MLKDDYYPFSEMFDAVCSLLTRGSYRASAANTAMFFRAMARYELAVVRAAFDAHIADPQRGRFVPVPADLIAAIEGHAEADGRPGADEAWAIAARAVDEDATIIWTEDIACAWGICHPVMKLGDEVGARVAFRDAYNRIVGEARKGKRPVLWTASLGHDVQGRAVALRDASSLGRLAHDEALLLEGPSAHEPMQGLLDSTSMPANVRARLLAVRERLTTGIQLANQPSSEDVIARQRTEALQDETLRKIEAAGLTHELTKTPLPTALELKQMRDRREGAEAVRPKSTRAAA